MEFVVEGLGKQTVKCRECGKKYFILPEKMGKRTQDLQCVQCRNIITVAIQSAPGETDYDSILSSDIAELDDAGETDFREEITEEVEDEPVPESPPESEASEYEDEAETSGFFSVGRKFGLKTKLFSLFLVIPMIIIAISGFFYLHQFSSLSTIHIEVGSKMITQMARYLITEQSRSTAAQCQVYLEDRPFIQHQNFSKDTKLKGLALNDVGQSGFTFLYAVAIGNTAPSVWLHPDNNFNGSDLTEALSISSSPSGKELARVIKFAAAGKNIESAGQFLEKDDSGNMREKFIFMAPIEGTPYGIAATTYLDEFTRLIKVMEARSTMMSKNVRASVFGIVIGTALLVGSIVFLYTRRLTGSIKSLTTVADQISVGDLDAVLNIKSGDEIEDLANSITRMQTSIKLAINRMRGTSS